MGVSCVCMYVCMYVVERVSRDTDRDRDRQRWRVSREREREYRESSIGGEKQLFQRLPTFLKKLKTKKLAPKRIN